MSLGLVNDPIGECWKRIKLQFFDPEYEFILLAYCYSDVWNFDTKYNTEPWGKLPSGQTSLGLVNDPTWECWKASSFSFLILNMNLFCLLIVILMFEILIQNTVLNQGVNCLQLRWQWASLTIPLENVANEANFGFLILKMNLLFLLIIILMFDILILDFILIIHPIWYEAKYNTKPWG